MTIEATQIPDGWRIAQLGEVAEVAFSSVDKKTVEGEVAVELCNYTDVFYNPRIVPGMPFMAATASPAECEKWTLRRGDVLFTKDSEPPDEIGIPSYVVDDLPGVLYGYHLGLARPAPRSVVGAFLARALGSQASSREFARIANGVTRFGLTLKATRSLPILLPPLPEQRAIAAILDGIDEAIERTEGIITATERVRDALLHELLTRGLPGRHSEWVEVPGLGTVPACWEVTQIGACLERIEAGRSPQCESRPARDDEWGVLKVSSVSWGVFQPTENKALLRPSDVEPGFEVREGDLILSRANTPDLVGRAAIVRASPPRLLLSDKTLRLVPDRGRIGPEFLLSSLNHPRSRSQIMGSATGTSRSMFNVSQDSIRRVRVVLPPIDEQEAIAAALNSVDIRVAQASEERARLQSLQASAADALLTGRVRAPSGTPER